MKYIDQANGDALDWEEKTWQFIWQTFTQNSFRRARKEKKEKEKKRGWAFKRATDKDDGR